MHLLLLASSVLRTDHARHIYRLIPDVPSCAHIDQFLPDLHLASINFTISVECERAWNEYISLSRWTGKLVGEARCVHSFDLGWHELACQLSLILADARACVERII